MSRLVRTSLWMCVLFTVVTIVAGCSKKEKPTAEVSGETTSQDVNTTQQAMQHEPITVDSDEDLTPPPPPPEPVVADVNRSARTQPVLKEQITQVMAGDKKITESSDLRQDIPPEQGLEQFESFTSSEEKVNWIAEMSESNPDSLLGIVDTALDDPDEEVRQAAMEALVDSEPNAPGLSDVVTKAIFDSDPQVRESAVEACGFVEGAQADELLAQALDDESDDVRMSVFDVIENKDTGVQLKVLTPAIASRYKDVREGALSTLIDISSPAAMDILIEGLKDPDADFRDDVTDAISFLVSEDFEDYQQAKKWWNANRHRFDDELFELNEE